MEPARGYQRIMPPCVRSALVSGAVPHRAIGVLPARAEAPREGIREPADRVGQRVATCYSCQHSIGGWADGPILIRMRGKPRPSDLVAKQPLGEAVELGRGRIARTPQASVSFALDLTRASAVARCTVARWRSARRRRTPQSSSGSREHSSSIDLRCPSARGVALGSMPL